MNSHVTRRFREHLAALPASVQRQARADNRLFREHPDHPSLGFKPVHGNDPTLWSIRIGLHYRAQCTRERDILLWFWIGSDAAYDRLLRRA